MKDEGRELRVDDPGCKVQGSEARGRGLRVRAHLTSDAAKG